MEDTFEYPATKTSGYESAAASPRTIGSLLAVLFSSSAWLSVTGVLMLADIAISLVGLAMDPATVMGAPAWLKPLKFGISTALFSFTCAYMIGHLRKTRRFALLLGRVMAAALVLEIVLIDMQAARHTSSHFNWATNFDRAIFSVMGVGIAFIFISTGLLFLATCRERFPNRSMGWAMRLGLLIALAGMGTGALMTLPSPEQLAAARNGAPITRMGGHTVGAPDGGASLPVTGWSADHGDLRIAHFLGLHAMQVLLLAWWIVRSRPEWTQPRQTRLVAGVAASCALAFAVVLWQALRGQPLLRPDALTLCGWAAWAVASVAFLVWVTFAASSSNGQSAAELMEEKQG